MQTFGDGCEDDSSLLDVSSWWIALCLFDLSPTLAGGTEHSGSTALRFAQAKVASSSAVVHRTLSEKSRIRRSAVSLCELGLKNLWTNQQWNQPLMIGGAC
jgi:hypothetical protein